MPSEPCSEEFYMQNKRERTFQAEGWLGEHRHRDGEARVRKPFWEKPGEIAWKTFTDRGGNLTLLSVVGTVKDFEQDVT